MLFNERELNKKDFERIDIDVRTMPKEIKEKLLNGEITPLLEIRDQMDNGVIATMPVKLRLQRSEDGKAVLKAYPVSKDIVSDLKLTEAEQKLLQDGEVIKKDIREGNRTRAMYLQLDQETKSLLKRDIKTVELEKRIDELEHVKHITLGQNQCQAIREGKPVELEVGDTKPQGAGDGVGRRGTQDVACRPCARRRGTREVQCARRALGRFRRRGSAAVNGGVRSRDLGVGAWTLCRALPRFSLPPRNAGGGGDGAQGGRRPA